MKKFVTALMAILLLLSCSKDKDMTIARGCFDLSLNAQLPEMNTIDDTTNVETRAATHYTVRIKWAKGDKITVINLTTGKILGGQLISNSAGTSTTFTGTLSGTINNGDKILYLYPALENSEEDDFKKVTIDMSTQKGTKDAPLCVYSTVVASDNIFKNTSISFTYLMSYIMIGMSDIPASTSIKNAHITNVVNSFEITPDNTDFSITPHIGNITLTTISASSASGNRTVYAAIPASPSGYTRHMILETNTSKFSTLFTSSELKNSTAYNTNVSGFLTDNLTIKDNSMQEYCLKHFDANNDGKLTMVEISGVKSFPDQITYPIPSDITEFNELEYFYGLTELPSFKNCTRLGSITIPKHTDLIPSEMFYGCTSLTKVILKPQTPPVLGTNVFIGQAGELMLVVSDESVAKYQSAVGWKEYFNNFKTESGEGDSKVDIETEDDEEMGNEHIEIIVK